MMETYTWIVPLCFLLGLLLLLFLALRSITKTKWQIVLRDGTKFIGKRTLEAMWQEGFFESAYKVMDSLDSHFQEGTIVYLGWSAKLYRIKVK